MAYTVQKYVGRGRVYVSEDTLGWIDMGEAIFNLTLETTEIEMMSVRQGLKTTAAKDTIQIKATGNISTKDHQNEIMNLWFLGDGLTDDSQPSGTATDENLTAYIDKWCEIGGFGNRRRHVSNVVVVNTTGDVTYEDTTDYELHLTDGMIKPITDVLTDGDTLVMTYDYAQVTANRIDVAAGGSKHVHIHFKGENAVSPDTTEPDDMELRGYASIKPDGDFKPNAEEDEYNAMAFAVEFEEHSSYNQVVEVYLNKAA